jgi:hypothetical protein
MQSKMVAAVLLCGSIAGSVGAQDYRIVELLMRRPFDEERVTYHRSTIEHVRSLLAQSRAETLAQFKEEMAKAGIDFFGLFAIDFGGKRAESDFRSWREALLRMDLHEFMNHEGVLRESKRMSPVLMDVLRRYLEQGHPGKLIAWVVAHDDFTFTLGLKYERLPAEAEGAELACVTFMTSSGEQVSVHSDEARMIQPGQRVSPAGMAVTFRRAKPSIAVTVTVNTRGRGQETIHVGAVDVLERKAIEVEELEGQVSGLGERVAVATAEVEVAKGVLRPAEEALGAADVGVNNATATEKTASRAFASTQNQVLEERHGLLVEKYGAQARATGKTVEACASDNELSALFFNLATNRGLYDRKKELGDAQAALKTAEGIRNERGEEAKKSQGAVLEKEKELARLRAAQEIAARKAGRVRRQLEHMQPEGPGRQSNRLRTHPTQC